MKTRSFLLAALCVILAAGSGAQVIRPFAQRYYNSSVRGNIVYVSNSIISTAGVGSGNPGTGEVAPAGTSKDNNGAGIYLDVDGAGTAATMLVAYGSQWRFHDTVTTTVVASGRLTNWNQSSYNDTWWRSGNAVIQYNDAGTTTANNPGNATFPTTYFRKTVNIPSVSAYTDFTINLRRDDAAIVYINGVKVYADAFLTAPITYLTPATPATNIEGANEFVTIQIAASKFVNGNNTIAVEVHNQTNIITANIRDMLFDLEFLGNVANTTFSSSTADLSLPSCSHVLFAGLYWGGDQGTSGTDSAWITGGAETTVKLKLPGGSYQLINSTQTNYHSLAWSTAGFNHTGYLCFADITSLVNLTSANGTYTVANVLGPVGVVNACGGWTIVIVYSNSSLPPRNLTVFDGAVVVNLGDPAVDVPLTGFLTPPSGTVSCELGAVVYDGDRGSSDSFAFKQNGAATFYNLATATVPLNGAGDAWNSKISYKGSIVTTRNPAFQNTLGYDAPIFDLPNTGNAQLGNSQTAATVRFSSPSENYFVHVLTTSISQYNPSFSLDKTATDVNAGSLVPGDVLRYVITYNNVGNDVAMNSIITDIIPTGTTYAPGSLKINGVAKTDATGDDQANYDNTARTVSFRLGTGATAAAGGSVTNGTSGTVQFDVYVPSSCIILSCNSTISNRARIDYKGQTSLSNLYDSSGVTSAGCLSPGAVINTVVSSCYTPSDTILINNCPLTNITLPYIKYAGYSFYSAMPFVSANIFNPVTAVTTTHTYYAYFNSGVGCSDTITINVFINPCPDIDDDNDGIPDYVEINIAAALQDANGNGVPNWKDATYPGYVDNNGDGFNDNFDPAADSDGDGIPNFLDSNFPGFIDSNGDGVNDNMDKDLDGIPNNFDLDSDNDGIPDTVESFGADSDGDGRIDNYTDTDNDGFSQNVDGSNTGVNASGVGLGAIDTDGDGLPNYLDSDSDNDGIPDAVEVYGTDANNNGKIDSYIDSDGDGLSDNIDGDVGNDGIIENGAAALLKTGPEVGGTGRCGAWPNKNMDGDSRANPYDLDSDGDGIVDVVEAGFTDANYDGLVDGAVNVNGWNSGIAALGSLTLVNTDATGRSNLYDIDSDDDGIPDNVEGLPTNGYLLPAGADTDGDGIDNSYDNISGFGGRGIHPVDTDLDTIPDYLDGDTDGDGVIDRVEGNDLNFNGMPDDIVTLTGIDTDGDGLDNRFDANNLSAEATSRYMGNAGMTLGDLTPGSTTTVQKTFSWQTDRDWRYVDYVLELNYLAFKASILNEIVHLNWTLVTDHRVDHFILERSVDGIQFNSIMNIPGQAIVDRSVDYSSIDNISGLTATTIYYRLKAVTAEGKMKLSNVAVIRKTAEIISLRIMPNPVKKQLQFNFNSDINGLAFIEISDAYGRVVTKFSKSIRAGDNTVIYNELNAVPNGVYYLQLRLSNEIFTQKFVFLR